MYELKNNENEDRPESGGTGRVHPAVAAARRAAESPETGSENGTSQPSGEKRIDRAAYFREQMQKAQKRRRRNVILDILLVVFLVIFVVSGVLLFRYYHASKQNKELLGSLKDMIDTDAAPDPAASPAKEGSGGQTPGQPASEAQVSDYVTVDGKEILRMYRALYEKNKDFIGWLTIEGTNVDLPVMYTPEQEQKYLRMNYDGEYALAGTPFIAAGCDPKRPSANLIIYGHNMKDGSMFSDLLNYKDEEYYRFHKYIQFDTIYGRGSYEVIAAFPGQVLDRDEEGFRYYYFYDAETPEEFDTYVSEVKARCTYNIAATASYGDQLITLSTCENSGASEGKRYVVVARRYK